MHAMVEVSGLHRSFDETASCFADVQISTAIEPSIYATLQLELEVLSLRLSRWSVVSHVTHDSTIQVSTQFAKLAQTLFTQIQGIFSRARVESRLLKGSDSTYGWHDLSTTYKCAIREVFEIVGTRITRGYNSFAGPRMWVVDDSAVLMQLLNDVTILIQRLENAVAFNATRSDKDAKALDEWEKENSKVCAADLARLRRAAERSEMRTTTFEVTAVVYKAANKWDPIMAFECLSSLNWSPPVPLHDRIYMMTHVNEGQKEEIMFKSTLDDPDDYDSGPTYVLSSMTGPRRGVNYVVLKTPLD